MMCRICGQEVHIRRVLHGLDRCGRCWITARDAGEKMPNLTPIPLSDGEIKEADYWRRHALERAVE